MCTQNTCQYLIGSFDCEIRFPCNLQLTTKQHPSPLPLLRAPMAFCTQSKLVNFNPLFITSNSSITKNTLLFHEHKTARNTSLEKTRNHTLDKTFPAAASPASSSSEVSVVFEEGELERPRWTGETPLSRLVAALIAFKPLYSVMKYGARQVLISTAEKTNIPWREMTKEILESDVYKELERIENRSLQYPDYYLNPFHAYDEGNLSWLAAAEAEAATMSMVRRAIPDASSLDEANQIVRGNWLKAIEDHHQQFSGDVPVRGILDIGCSVGVSTRFLADKFCSAKVSGLDLSPYFLAVASYKEKRSSPRPNPIDWIHGNGESTSLPSQSFDLVSIAYMFHECPERAINNVVKEAFRLLRPGGTFAVTDNSPKSKILQNLSPVLFTLMKSTEPFLDEYYLTDLEAVVREAGFINVETVLTDPRHRTLTATVPH